MSEIIYTNVKSPFQPSDRQWHDYERESGVNGELADAVVATVQDIENRQLSIYEGNRRHARIYCGYTPIGLTWGSGPGINVRQPFEATKNVARGVCDTATSLIIRNRPKASFVTSGGDFDIQTQAEDMDQFMYGAYSTSGLYEVAPRSFLDSTIFGTGGWKYITCGTGEDFKVETERVLIDDVIVDEDECRVSLVPSCIYHRLIVRVDALVKKYASGNSKKDFEFRNRILAAQEASHWPTRHVPKGRCVLIEATYVDPFGNNTNRHVLCIPGLTLKDEKWPFDFHPYTWLWWSLPVSGFYGDGVCYRQFGRQQRITYMYRWIQRVQDLFGTPRAWIDPSGGPPALSLSNELGAVITSRKPPTFQVQNPVPSDTYRWLDVLENGCFEDEGMTNGAGVGALPPGIDSAPAQREWNYRETQKFAPLSLRWEHAVAIEPAEKMIAMYRHHIETGGGPPKVSWANRKRMYTVKWPDLDKDAFVIQASASSLDSLSPAARVQSALELAQTGWLTPQEGRALVAHPDLKESDDLGNAGETYAKFVLLKLRKGEIMVVDEKADMPALDRIIRQGRLLAITQEAPAPVVDNMTRYLEELDSIQQTIVATQMAQQQQAMAMMQPAVGPGGAPGPHASVPLSR